MKYSSLKTKILDLSYISWFYPTLLLPLGIFLNDNPNIKFILPEDTLVSTYFNIMLRSSVKKGKTYTPLVKIPTNWKFGNKVLDPLISDQRIDVGGTNAFSYIIGELIDNIYEHSEFLTVFIMAQRYPKMEFTDISIIDNGISIPGSFKNKNYNFTNVESLKEAIKGKSTKDEEERGYGLRLVLIFSGKELKGNA